MTKRLERAATAIYLSTAAFVAVLGIVTTVIGLVLLVTGAPN